MILEQLRQAMRAWTTGVTIVTAKYDDQQYGMTVNSFTSISLEPPLISVTLKRLTHTHELVEKAGEFALTILASHQSELSDRFSGKLAIQDRFEGLITEKLLIEAPLLTGGLAYLNCRVVNTMSVGENTLFIAEVIAAANGAVQGDPLVYHNRVFWKLDSPSP